MRRSCSSKSGRRTRWDSAFIPATASGRSECGAATILRVEAARTPWFWRSTCERAERALSGRDGARSRVEAAEEPDPTRRSSSGGSRSGRSGARVRQRRPGPARALVEGATSPRVFPTVYARSARVPEKGNLGEEGHLPARRRILRGARSHAFGPGQGGHSRPGSLPRSETGAWPLLFGAAWSGHPTQFAEYFHRAEKRSGDRAAGSRSSYPLGRAGRPLAQCNAQRRSRESRQPSKQRVGEVHGRRYRCTQQGTRRPGIRALGELRAEKGRLYRCRETPGLEGPASFPALGASRIFRLQAFFEDQQLSAGPRQGADRLAPAEARGLAIRRRGLHLGGGL